MRELEFYCSNSTASSCFAKMEDFLDHVEKCYRQWHAVIMLTPWAPPSLHILPHMKSNGNM